jgi:hypothetical protein
MQPLNATLEGMQTPERPILFSGAMVRAVLDGRKTQTRRLLAPGDHTLSPNVLDLCRYGKAGDRLWGRETWQYADWTEDGYPWVRYRADGTKVCIDRDIPEEWSERLTDIWANLSDPANYEIDQRAADRRWRPAIHMPRWACRIVLEVVAVRVERLQDITEADARAEGAVFRDFGKNRWGNQLDGWSMEPESAPSWEHCLGSARFAFANLINKINGEKTWRENPWVWVVEFRSAAAPALAKAA